MVYLRENNKKNSKNQTLPDRKNRKGKKRGGGKEKE